MGHAYRVLRVAFESRAELGCEFFNNFVHGGLFIPGAFDLIYGEPVVVLVVLPFVAGAIEFGGCVVQTLPREFEAHGGRCGVAFEFHSVTEPSPELEAGSMPIEVARLEAARGLDEGRRSSHAALPPESGLRVQHREIDLKDPKRSKVEQSILDLAGLGMNIARLIETIQEPDGLIEGCILDLVERGAVRYEENGASH